MRAEVRKLGLCHSVFGQDSPGGLMQATRGEAGRDNSGGDMGQRRRH